MPTQNLPQQPVRCRLLPPLLRQLREQIKLTQRDLAKRLRMTHVAVDKSESGERRVDVTAFMDWCLACGVDPEEAFRSLRRSRGT